MQLQSEAYVSKSKLSCLHALRIGDIGRRFDGHGGISLACGRWVRGEVQQFVYFMQVDPW